jgi:hypothetical protein
MSRGSFFFIFFFSLSFYYWKMAWKRRPGAAYTVGGWILEKFNLAINSYVVHVINGEFGIVSPTIQGRVQCTSHGLRRRFASQK